MLTGYVEGTVLDFGRSVSYACEEGFFFDDSKTRESFELECSQEEQGWESIDTWKFCVDPFGNSGIALSYLQT